MTELLDVEKRPLPSFKAWIEEVSPETQADGFAELADLVQRTRQQDQSHLQPHEASFGRMWLGACIAAVEICNMEAMKHGRPGGEIVAHLPRVFAAAAMYAMASRCRPDTPFRQIAKIMVEEFRMAAKTAADALERDRELDPESFGEKRR